MGYLDAHGGLQRWRATEAVHGRYAREVLLPNPDAGNRFAVLHRAWYHEPGFGLGSIRWTVPQVFEAGVADRESAMARPSARAPASSVLGALSGLPSEHRWDPLGFQSG